MQVAFTSLRGSSGNDSGSNVVAVLVGGAVEFAIVSNDVDFRARVISSPGPDDGLLAGSSSNGDNDAGSLNNRRRNQYEIIDR